MCVSVPLGILPLYLECGRSIDVGQRHQNQIVPASALVFATEAAHVIQD